MSYARWTPTAAQTNTCPPHTWIHSWDRDVEALQASALAAGWQWHLALTPLHHQRVIDLHQLAATRYADDYRIPRHMPGPATSAPFNTSFSPWAPASIAAIDTSAGSPASAPQPAFISPSPPATAMPRS